MYGTGIFKGMGITLKRLFRKPITELYPYDKMKELPKRSRAFLAHNVKEDGSPACLACGLCERGCPDMVLRVTQHPEDRKKAQMFEWYMGRCTFCGLCVEACPYDAIAFTQDFEGSTFAHADLKVKLIDDGAATVVAGVVANKKVEGGSEGD